MNTKTLESMYAGFDLHYERSDDHNVWSKGNKQWQTICHEEQRLIHGGLASVDEIEFIKSKYIKSKYFGELK